MVRAYVLLQTEVGMVEQILEEISGSPGVAWADPVAGPYDVIAAFEEDSPEVLERLGLDGVIRTVTCPARQH